MAGAGSGNVEITLCWVRTDSKIHVLSVAVPTYCRVMSETNSKDRHATSGEG